MNEIIKHIPAVALRGMTILPSMIVHFDVSRDKSIKAIEHAMVSGQKLFVTAQKNPDTADPAMEDLYRIGTIVEIKQLVKLPHDILRVLVEGLERAELLDLDLSAGYLDAEVAGFQEDASKRLGSEDKIGQTAMIRNLKELFQDYQAANGKMSQDLVRQIMEMDDLERLVDQIAIHIPLYYEDKQRLLEAVHLYDRYELLCVILGNEVNIMHIRAELQEKVKERIDKNQKEYILREQLKLIREELGDDTTFTDVDHFRQQLSELTAGQDVKERIEKEIKRFASVAGNSSESSVIRGYIETLLEMPWDKMSDDCTDIAQARAQLDADHYGLEKVKERVLEFLAVRTLTKKGDSPILCLVGPPGTGKTSIAKSIAVALNKKYVRICLGGVRDEAEIRGHRRTYVGAMPGRIANGMKMAGVKNPLMLLDEIDKVSSDYKGDTSSALLEVLDPEQNVRFRDHYIEIPIDLSEVLFIATANDVQTIPRPLLDRMELIEISSYTENEKLHIAKEHLLDKQIRRHGLDNYSFRITDGALKKIISCYTREAGVRNLERKLGEICRKAAKEILEEGRLSIRVTESSLDRYLGKERYSIQKLNEKDEVGIVRGLAWTSVGGDTLQIEVNNMPGKGEFRLTGQLGDVMKESAQAGISYIRSVGEKWNIDREFFKEHDLHIHIPEGAVPKDGPSAGITMATAMMSAITGIPVRADIAMTGEITLRGRVLPIGGLKEKLLAAKNAGMRMVLVPEKNRVDVQEISNEIKKGLDIRFVENMDEVLEYALVKK
ncbi:MAG: endopeptidase La [Lachnospiraceae bacterium]|nr:endopeptidase La [Lachnospiraceae bacterium]